MQVRKEVLKLKDPARAVALQRFFKTGPGEYGEDDIFYGLTTPQLRVLAKKFSDLSLPDSLRIIEILMKDDHDLIHKACGWIFREIGKRDESVLKNFLNKYATKMPRTQLRYAIEKFPPKMREYYLKLK